MALLAAAPAATADPVPYPAAHFPQELEFARARLLWTDTDGRLRAQDPGGAPRVLFAPRGRGGARLYALALRGAPQAAIAADGTVLVLQGDALAWASPASPTLHPIGRSVDVVGGLGNGTAVFAVRVAGGFEVIRAAELTTGAVRDVSPRLTRIEAVRPDLAWNGAQVAYDNGSCVLAGDLPAAAPATTPVVAGCPRPPLTTEVRTLERKRAVRIGARCHGGSADRCTGTIRITARIGGRARVLASRRLNLAGGTAAQLTLTAKRSLLRRVRVADGGRRTRLEIRMTDGRVDDRTQSVTFRA